MALEREAKRDFPPQIITKEVTIDSSTQFSVMSEDFIISPLQSAASLYIVSIHEGVENIQKIADLNADEYTQISGCIPGVKFYIDTNEKFYIKF